MKPFCVLLSILVVLLNGCAPSNRPAGLPPLHPCTVTVTQNGTPLADVSVQLISKETEAWPTTGVTDASGNAVIVTYGRFHGTPVGEYTVVLSKTESVSTGGQSGEETNSGTTEIFSLIAVEYTKAETSKLRMTVSVGKNAQSFDIGAPVRVLVDTIKPGT